MLLIGVIEFDRATAEELAREQVVRGEGIRATRIADRCVRVAADRCRGNAGRWSPWPRKLPRRMGRDQELLPGDLLEQNV